MKQKKRRDSQIAPLSRAFATTKHTSVWLIRWVHISLAILYSSIVRSTPLTLRTPLKAKRF